MIKAVLKYLVVFIILVVPLMLMGLMAMGFINLILELVAMVPNIQPAVTLLAEAWIALLTIWFYIKISKECSKRFEEIVYQLFPDLKDSEDTKEIL